MLSKPLAALFLVGALAAAALAGGYIASKHFRTKTDDQLAAELLEEPSAKAPAPGSAAAAGAGGGVGAASKPRPAGASPSRPRPSVSGAPAASSPAGQSAASPSGGGGGGEGAPDPVPVFEEFEIPSGQILDIQLQAPLSSETAKVEDRVECRTTKPVNVGQTAVIPPGTKVVGWVTEVDKGGRIREAAKLTVRLDRLILANHPEVPLSIDPLEHVGPSPSGDSKLKIGGGAAAGAAIGWLKGGLGGALKGAAVGGGGGAGAKIVEGRKPAVLPAGAQARVELRAPIRILVCR